MATMIISFYQKKKLDSSFLEEKFLIFGYGTSYGVARNCHRGGRKNENKKKVCLTANLICFTFIKIKKKIIMAN